MKKVREIFHPSKITLAGKASIVDTTSGKYVIKEKNKDLKSLFNYLDSRSFNNYPNIIDEYDNKIVYEYLNDTNAPPNQKASDMGNLLASLHYKTSHYISIVKDDIKEVYENILGNIIYFENYYQKLFTLAFNEEYVRPSYYLLLRNESKINALIRFLKDELEKWYKEAINKDKTRVVYCHNNLSLDHYKTDKKNYFISWDNYKIDSPILDLINLYHNDFNKYDYSNFLSTYLKQFDLLPEEKRLFFIVISLPQITYFNDNEMDNTIMVGKLIDYIGSTEKLIRPYYPIENVKE
jgi:hypothetical protein